MKQKYFQLTSYNLPIELSLYTNNWIDIDFELSVMRVIYCYLIERHLKRLIRNKRNDAGLQ